MDTNPRYLGSGAGGRHQPAEGSDGERDKPGTQGRWQASVPVSLRHDEVAPALSDDVLAAYVGRI
jgi:hypothetical protein